MVNFPKIHCVRSVRIRSFSGLFFFAFELNLERYGVSLRIQSKCGKIRTREIPNTDTFHAVITLVSKNEVINNEEKIAESLNVFFTDIVSNLKIPLYQSTDFARGIDPITFILEKCKNHPSIKEVKENCHKNHSFNFKTIKRDDVLKKKN